MSAEWPLVNAGQKGPRVKARQRLLLQSVHVSADGIVGPHTWQPLVVGN